MSDQPYIAVVDDDASVRKALERLLRIAQMDVHCYASAEKFLSSLEQRSPDCLVLDIRMPGITGLELRDRLVAQKLLIPIVFITAHGEEAVAEHGTAGDGADVLLKPFSDEVLLAAIARSIARGEAA